MKTLTPAPYILGLSEIANHTGATATVLCHSRHFAHARRDFFFRMVGLLAFF